MTNIDKILKQYSFKVTDQRTDLLEVFYSVSEPLCVDQIFSLLEGKYDLATIYRTVASFEKAGLLRRVDLRKGAQYYERTDSRHHHHIVCSTCGETEDFEMCGIDRIADKALKHSSFKKIDSHSLELFGICSKCAKA